MINSTVVHMHHVAPARIIKAEAKAIWRSCDGLGMKTHAAVNALGNLAEFYLNAGQAHDLEGADALLSDTPGSALT